MNRHRTVACPPSTGGEYDERLFTEQTECSRCNNWFNDDELLHSKTLGGYYCQACYALEEAAHYGSEDYEGEVFG